jgi:VanZ family protein
LAHFISYGFLAGAFLYSLQPYFNTFKNKFILAVIVVVFCVLFGISDEYHQAFIPGRFASLWDLMADGFGALFVVVWWLSKVR